ncbi:unnamed protein product [Ectocarpus sp. 12 AP-2014]
MVHAMVTTSIHEHSLFWAVRMVSKVGGPVRYVGKAMRRLKPYRSSLLLKFNREHHVPRASPARNGRRRLNLTPTGKISTKLASRIRNSFAAPYAHASYGESRRLSGLGIQGRECVAAPT